MPKVTDEDIEHLRAYIERFPKMVGLDDDLIHAIWVDNADAPMECRASVVAELFDRLDQAPLMEHYSQALDEIYRLRAAMAYEAAIIKAHCEYKTFPQSRRRIAGEQVERMHQSARGRSKDAYSGQRAWMAKDTLIDAGASETLTRWEWEAENVTR